MKPICVGCQRFYRVKRNGYAFVEAMPLPQPPVYSPIAPGAADPEHWTPYKLWSGDLWECQGCGHQIVSGVAFAPIAEHYQPEFKAQVERFGATLQVNDC